MKTVTIVAGNRAMYTAHALGAVAKSLMSAGEGSFDKLIVSIDPDEEGKVNADVEMVCEKSLEVITSVGLIDCHLYTNIKRMGLGGNHIVTLQRAFEEHKSDFNVMVEDDAVLKLDAIPLANWFYEEHGGPFSEYLLLSMCNHRAFGRGRNPGDIPDDPSFLAEATHITAPFAWATSKWKWPFIKATWNRKKLPPNGWDWSLSYYMALTKQKSLHPILSRCENIGREGGSNETSASFERTQTGIVFSDGSYDGEYVVAAKFPFENIGKMEEWMMSENLRMFPR